YCTLGLLLSIVDSSVWLYNRLSCVYRIYPYQLEEEARCWLIKESEVLSPSCVCMQIIGPRGYVIYKVTHSGTLGVGMVGN
ncbi:hypothetical protein BGW80DRAFT_1300113, partial [Lactifluus volemus]